MYFQHVAELRRGSNVLVPNYWESDEEEDYSPPSVLILEGLYTYFGRENAGLSDLKVFVQADELIRLRRRLNRDPRERGIPERVIVKKWQKTVQPMYEEFVEKQRPLSDIVIINN